jgi:hypothetical protein
MTRIQNAHETAHWHEVSEQQSPHLFFQVDLQVTGAAAEQIFAFHGSFQYRSRSPLFLAA